MALAKIPFLADMTQSDKKIKIPEIRVWCHPHKIGEKGDDYYKVFNSFKEAMEFIITHNEAEEVPLIAFNGFEFNFFDISFDNKTQKMIDKYNKKIEKLKVNK